MQRFFDLLSIERREIIYLYVYAVAAGLISLSLPLGIQSIIGFVSSGEIPVSVIVLIGLILLGLLLVGGLQIMQLWLVEFIQQRIFARTAFDFAYRIPRMQQESLLTHYPPELMNRFFDVPLLQKGVAKILIDFSTAVIQIVFGLILLSLYHPYFIFFGFILIVALIAILWATSEKGIKTSLQESKYKYKLVAWLEEMAGTLSTFQLVGHTNLPLERTDTYVNSYLKVRKQHFKVLMTQYYSFVGFKTFITGGLLILGCILVVTQEINIGQFVASEIVIILIMTAVEKIIMKLDTVYDVLTSLDKIGTVTDIPIEEAQGIRLSEMPAQQGLQVEVKNLTYNYPDTKKLALKNIEFTIGASEHVCISGFSSSGKSTLINLILGLLPSYEGSIAFNGLSLRDIDKPDLRSMIGDNISREQVFDGTFIDNITLGRKLPLQDVVWAIEVAGLTNYVHTLNDGMQTHLTGGSFRLPASIARKIILARSLALRPRLLIIDDFWADMEKQEKMRLLTLLLDKQFNWTVLIVSNDKDVITLCDKMLLMQSGEIIATGTYEQIRENEYLQKLTDLKA